MTLQMFLSQVIFWIIVLMAWFVYREFKRSTDGKLRVLIMELFLAKMWCYGISGVYYLFWDFHFLQDWNTVALRVVCNLPMMIVMVRLYLFIRKQ